MSDELYKKLFEDLKGAVIDPVSAEAKKFLADNKDAQDFMEERAKRFAELGVEYVQADTDEKRENVSLQMKVVRQAMANEISKVAVDASAAARAKFTGILNAAVDVLLKALPAIVAAL